MKRIIIAGAGALGRELACWIENIAARDAQFELAGFIDDTIAPRDALSDSYPYPVLDSIAAYEPKSDELVVIAQANPQHKLRMARDLEGRGAAFFNVIHPTAVIARTAKVGRGIILCPFSLLSADCTVEDFVTINTYSSIGHDAVIGTGSTLSSHVDITGRVVLSTGVFIGSNATLLPGVKVGASATIGAGSVVMRNVAEATTVYALPAKKL